MRCYQEVGLKPEARKWLADNCERTPIKECPTCHHVEGGTLEVLEVVHVDSFYLSGPNLRTYRVKRSDGREQLVREVVQAEPWSSGPVAFFCLELMPLEGWETPQRMFEWSEEEIEEKK